MLGRLCLINKQDVLSYTTGLFLLVLSEELFFFVSLRSDYAQQSSFSVQCTPNVIQMKVRGGSLRSSRSRKESFLRILTERNWSTSRKTKRIRGWWAVASLPILFCPRSSFWAFWIRKDLFLWERLIRKLIIFELSNYILQVCQGCIPSGKHISCRVLDAVIAARKIFSKRSSSNNIKHEIQRFIVISKHREKSWKYDAQKFMVSG